MLARGTAGVRLTAAMPAHARQRAPVSACGAAAATGGKRQAGKRSTAPVQPHSKVGQRLSATCQAW